MNRCRAITIFLLALCWCSIAHARSLVLHVGDAGDEFPTLSAALKGLEKERRLAESLDVVIRIEKGTHYDRDLVFRPPSWLSSLDLVGVGEETIMDGQDNSEPFLRIVGVSGQPTHVRISNLVIRRYRTAIELYGSREIQSASNSYNSIEHVSFEDLGSRGEGLPSTAVVLLVNSSYNFIRDNTFKDIYNTRGCGAIHSLYIAHFSSNNIVERNHFEQRCGDPIRLRDSANDNEFRDNTFERAAQNAWFTEWFCDSQIRSNCTKQTPECPPKNNIFEQDGRRIVSGQARDRVYFGPLETTSLSPACLGR